MLSMVATLSGFLPDTSKVMMVRFGSKIYYRDGYAVGLSTSCPYFHVGSPNCCECLRTALRIESISNRHFPLLCQVGFQNGFMFMPFFRDETVENTDQHPS